MTYTEIYSHILRARRLRLTFILLFKSVIPYPPVDYKCALDIRAPGFIPLSGVESKRVIKKKKKGRKSPCFLLINDYSLHIPHADSLYAGRWFQNCLAVPFHSKFLFILFFPASFILSLITEKGRAREGL